MNNLQASMITSAPANKAKPALATSLSPAPELPELPELVLAEGGAVATPLTPPVTGPLSVSCQFYKIRYKTATTSLAVPSLLPIAMAAALKASYVLLPEVGALMLPTMPSPQWVI